MSYKQLYLIDSKGNATSVNHFELVAKAMNYWKGWRCWIGSSTLCIGQDGKMWRGVCQEGGVIGNALEAPNFELPQKPSVCHQELCGCAFDYFTPRYRDPESFERLSNLTVNEVANLADIVAVKPIRPVTEFAISWNIGMRCNYDCWYCSSHDNYSKFWTLEQMTRLIDAIDLNVKGKFEHIHFQILGGEPTINPDLIEACAYAVKLGHRVSVDSNGSRSGEYYIELLKVIKQLRFSIHLDYVKTPELYQKMSKLIDWIKINKPEVNAQIILKYMLQPGRLAELQEIDRELSKIPEFYSFVWPEVSPIVQQEAFTNGALYQSYIQKELDFIERPQFNRPRSGDY